MENAQVSHGNTHGDSDRLENLPRSRQQVTSETVADEEKRPLLRIPELETFELQNVQPAGVNLGNGAYGTVEEVLVSGTICAAKKMHDILIKSATPQEQKILIDTFLRECTLLSRLRHPHIVQFLGVCYLQGSRLPLLVMERLLISLDDLLENKTMSLPFDAKLSFLRDVAKGLVFLHSQTPPVIHRDLTARNVLLNSSYVAKIADLGVARIVNIQPGEVSTRMTKNPGNVVYMPPEAAEESAKYSTALDIFSYGNLAIFTLSRLFPDLKAATYLDSKTRKVIGRTEIERRMHVFQQLYTELGEEHELVQLSTQCLSNDPEERPSANDIMEHLARVNPTDSEINLARKIIILDRVAVAESTELPTDEPISSQDISSSVHEVSSLDSQESHLVPTVEPVLSDNPDPSSTCIINIEDIKIVDFIGHGAYGSVMKVEYRGKKYAAKIFNRKENLDEKFQKEVDILSQLQHDNIVRYFGITYTKSDDNAVKPVLMMELLCQESLHEYLQDKPRLPTATMLQLLHDVSKGLEYLHHHDVIHRDLTAKNVLLANENNVAKIADFGNSRVIEFESYTGVATMTADPGNRFYCAPETEAHSDGKHARYNHKVDCFAFGHLSIFAVIEEFPRNLVSGSTALKRRRPYVDQVKRKLGDHHKLVGIIERCLGEYPHERPSASSLQSELSELCTKEDTRSTQSSDSETDSEERRRELIDIL